MQPLSLTPDGTETQPFSKKGLDKKTRTNKNKGKAKGDGHCFLRQAKNVAVILGVKTKSQTLRLQMQTLSCRQVSSEEVKGM